MYKKRNLYGGAIETQTVSELIDASDIRQVPDNQEVFMYPDSGVSIIVEILEMVDPPLLEDAIKFHFDSLAHDNSARESTVNKVYSSTSRPPPATSGHEDTPAPILLQGLQKISKFNRSELDTVKIYMGLFRVKEKNVDLVVTFNVPIESQGGNSVSATGQQGAEADFNTFVESLTIKRFDLFV